MGELLLGGSAAAAYLAGVVAFFAPCCATVMLPGYLSTTVGAQGWRLVPLTALYVAGVATMVLPLTIGAAGLASLLNRYHAAMFIAGGAMMIAVGIATLSGRMWAPHLPAAPLGTGGAAVYGMGVFGGAATACCAPVLAGAVTIAGISGSWWVGAAMGVIYLLGLVTPLIITAAGFGRIRERLHDPPLTLALGGRKLETSRMRLIAAVAFVVLGAVAIALALSGQSDTAPAFQADMGTWLEDRAAWIVERVPLLAGWAAVALASALALALALRSHLRTRKEA